MKKFSFINAVIFEKNKGNSIENVNLRKVLQIIV